MLANIYPKGIKACRDASWALLRRVSGRNSIGKKTEHLVGEQADLHGARQSAKEGQSAVMPILINTMPKSGSIYLSRMIASSLGVEFSVKSLAYGFFPTYFMLPDALESFRTGNIVRQEHFDASPINLKVCGRFIDRIVLHVRDPRGALLSWAHHVNRLQKLHPNGIESTIHPIPDDFPSWPLSDQLDWHIEHHLVSLVGWLRQWLAVSQAQSPIRILWTSHEELANNERALFDKIINFFEVPMDRVDFQTPEKTMEVHYRSGEINEWSVVFSMNQKARCADIIGKDLLERFNWPSG